MSEYQCYEFVALDRPLNIDLVAAAASGNAVSADDGESFRRWVVRLPAKDKDAWLRRAADAPAVALGSELLRVIRATEKREQAGARRTVAELRAVAETRRDAREQVEAVRSKKVKEAAERKRQRRLTKLGRDVDAAWAKPDKLVESSGYDETVTLAVDLRDLATREGETQVFARRFEAMRKRQLRRRGFFDRWKRANEASRW
jgi:hypothetical protein